MSMWSLRFPDGPGLSQTFGSRLDAADDARKEAKMWGDDGERTLPCPACDRPSRMMRVAGCCPFGDCRHGSDAA